MGFHSSPKSDYTISNFQVFTEAAYLMPLTTCLDIEPYLGLGWSNLQREGFTEKHGQEANLKAKGLKEDRFAS